MACRRLAFAAAFPVMAAAIGPGLTGALIDRGVTLPEQLWWMAAWCVAATFALIVATRRTGRRLAAASAGA